MTTESFTVMEEMLAELKKGSVEARIHLKNGISLTGKIMRFDDSGVRITTTSHHMGIAIDRSAISSVQPKTDSDSSGGHRRN